jgi:signaling intermediate in Toll pathway protein
MGSRAASSCSLLAARLARHVCRGRALTTRWPAAPVLIPPRRHLRTTATVQFLDVRDKDHNEKEKRLIVHQGEYFDEAAASKRARDKKTFEDAVGLYLKRNGVYRRGHVEFLYAAIGRMKEFDVHRDLDTYKTLLALFPEEKMVAKTTWQVEFMHFPKQQQCCIDILDFMESHGVIPDDDMGYQLIRIFGKASHAFRKYQRMMYWMPKFKFANPYYVPYDLPTDNVELAKLALKRMSVDLETSLTVHMTEELENCADQTYIVSALSPEQSELIASHPVDKPVFVEGGFTVWLRSKSVTYFILRSDCTEKYLRFCQKPSEDKPSEDKDASMFQWSVFEEEAPKVLAVPPSVHEQEDGTILAMCITGSASKDSLTSWIRFLERSNRKLSQVPVVFRLRTPDAEIQVWEKRPEPSEIAEKSGR